MTTIVTVPVVVGLRLVLERAKVSAPELVPWLAPLLSLCVLACLAWILAAWAKLVLDLRRAGGLLADDPR